MWPSLLQRSDQPRASVGTRCELSGGRTICDCVEGLFLLADPRRSIMVRRSSLTAGGTNCAVEQQQHSSAPRNASSSTCGATGTVEALRRTLATKTLRGER